MKRILIALSLGFFTVSTLLPETLLASALQEQSHAQNKQDGKVKSGKKTKFKKKSKPRKHKKSAAKRLRGKNRISKSAEQTPVNRQVEARERLENQQGI